MSQVPFICSQIQQLPDIITDGGVVTRATWKSINTCEKIQSSLLIANILCSLSVLIHFLVVFLVNTNQHFF